MWIVYQVIVMGAVAWAWLHYDIRSVYDPGHHRPDYMIAIAAMVGGSIATAAVYWPIQLLRWLLRAKPKRQRSGALYPQGGHQRQHLSSGHRIGIGRSGGRTEI